MESAKSRLLETIRDNTNSSRSKLQEYKEIWEEI